MLPGFRSPQKTNHFNTHGIYLLYHTPLDWILSRPRTEMETTSPGILTRRHFTWKHHINTDQPRSRSEDDLQMNNKNNRYVNTKPEFGMRGCFKVFSKVLDAFITTNHANMPVQSVQARKRYLDTSHQSEPSSKPHKRVSSENTFPLSTAPSQQSPSCTNSRSNRHMPTLSLYRDNHHQQHFPYQHNNNNTSIINSSSSYYKYYCDYFKKFARRFSAKRLSRILPKWAKNFLSFLLVFQLVGTSMLTSALPLPKKKPSNEIKGMVSKKKNKIK